MSQQGAHAAPQYARLGEDAGRTHTAGSAAFAAPKARREAGAKACTASGAASATARHRAERRSEAIATSCKSRTDFFVCSPRLALAPFGGSNRSSSSSFYCQPIRFELESPASDGRPLPTKKRRRTSSKHCAPHLLLACAPHFHLPVN